MINLFDNHKNTSTCNYQNFGIKTSGSIFIYLDHVSLYGRHNSFSVFDSGHSNPRTTKVATILKSNIKSNSICNETLVYIKNNVSFIVNAKKLSHWKNIRTDTSEFVRSGST